MKDRYKLMGHVYDLLSNIYSGRRIVHCKEAMLTHVKPDDAVLFAGVGHGREAIKGAQLGARVTVVDLSETMLEKFRQGIASATLKHPVRQLHEDILKVSTDEQYDVVFANFFLNVFKREPMDAVVRHLAALTKPGGCLVVGDFAFPNGNFLVQIPQTLYWYIAASLFFVITRNAVHDIYNYPEYLKKYGLKTVDTKYYTIFGIKAYWSVWSGKPV